MTTITLPIDPKYFWAIVSFAAFALAVAAVYAAMPQTEAKRIDPLDRLKTLLGAQQFSDILFLLLLTMWGALFLALFGGLMLMLWEVIWHAVPTGEEAQSAARFALVRLTAMTATLGALVALPFTLYRLRLSREANDTAAESLFNDKINAATEDLHAMRQRWDGEQNIWEDDITRRNAAIDRLEGLANERPETAPRISRQLSVYVRELSREVTAVPPPKEATPKDLQNWARELEVQRFDMENAVQVLGRLKRIAGVDPEKIRIDLRQANLQGFNLVQLEFSGARLLGAQMQGAKLNGAQMQGARLTRAQMQGANLSRALLKRADLLRVQLQGANLSRAQMQEADLFEAQMQGANLSRAQMFGADLSRAKM